MYCRTFTKNPKARPVFEVRIRKGESDPLLHQGFKPLARIGLGESFNRPYPTECLGRWGGTTAAAIQRMTQAPDAVCAQSVVGAMSAVASLRGQVKTIFDTPMPSAVMLSTVALSGERKSTADAMASRGITLFEKRLRETIAANENAAKPSGRASATTAKNSAHTVRTAEIMVSDPTIEGLFDVMINGPGTAYLANDDAAGFFGGHAMSSDQRRKTIAAIASLFSGTAIRRPRATRENQVIEDVPLTMHLMFQPYLLASVYGDRELLDQGILPRILPVFPSSNIGSRPFRGVNAHDAEARDEFHARCFELLTEFASMRAEPLFGSGGHYGDNVLELSGEAKDVLIKFYNEIEGQSGEGGAYAGIRSFASRAAENATRLGAIFTVFDDPDSQYMQSVAAESGCQLMRYYLAAYDHICETSAAKKAAGEAVELGKWLYGAVGPGGTSHDKHLSQFGPAAFRDLARRRSALEKLSAHGWLRYLPKGTEVDGAKRAISFQVHPKLNSAFWRD